MDDASKNRVLNVIPSNDTENDWRFEDAVRKNVLGAPSRRELPESVDLANVDWKIQDQKDHGACVGMAVSDLLNWHFVKSGTLTKDQILSSRFVYMAAKEMDYSTDFPTTFLELAFTSLKTGLDIAKIYGCVLDSTLPFEPDMLCHTPQSDFYLEASDFRIRAYYNLGGNQDNWRAWLARKGPILTTLGVDTTWDNAKKTDGYLETYIPETVRGGHAILIVGYTEDRFKVKNSWGENWGDNGYGYASLQYARDAFQEAYGIII